MSGLISYRNLADAALLSSSPAVDGAYPLDNMKGRQLAVGARWSSGAVVGGLATVVVTVDLGAGVGLNLLQRPLCFGALGVNCKRLPGGPDIQIGCTVEGSPNGVSWTPIGSFTDSDRLEILPGGIVGYFPPSLNYRYYRLTFMWTTQDAFAQIGRLWVGNGLLLPDGCDSGWSISPIDPGRLDLSYGGQAYADRRVIGRRLRMSFGTLTSDLAYGFGDTQTGAAGNNPCFQELQIVCGTTGELIMLPRLSTSHWIRRAGVYGHLADEFEIRHVAGPNYAVDLTMNEER